MGPLEVGTGTVALLESSLLVPPVYASATIDAKASPLAIGRCFELAIQTGEAVLFLEDSLDVSEQCTRIAIAEILPVRRDAKVNG